MQRTTQALELPSLGADRDVARPRDPLKLWPAAGSQWLSVDARIPFRYLITYRAPALALARLVPAPLELDTRNQHGFLSVCALHLRQLGPCSAPSVLRFDTLEFLFRVAVRFRGSPSFFTLHSQVSSRRAAWLGKRFSHYRPRLCHFATQVLGSRRTLEARNATGRSLVDVSVSHERSSFVNGSVFAGLADAEQFLLGMTHSIDVTPRGRVRVQEIDHDPWQSQSVTVHYASFDWLNRLDREHGLRLEFDSALGMENIAQTWKAAQWA